MNIFRFQCFAVMFLLILLAGADARAKENGLTSAEANGLLSQGHAAYRAGKLDDAASYYQQLVDSGHDSAEILYNLGTVEARLNHKGRALAYLQKAREKAPRNGDIRFNLQKLRAAGAAASSDGGDEEVDGIATESLWYRVVFCLTLAEWLFLLWLMTMVVSSAVLLWVLLRGKSRRAPLFRGIAWACGVFLVILLIPVAGRFYYLAQKRSVALVNTGVHSGPSSRFTENAQLPEGSVVRTLLDDIDGYSQVRLENGQVGYVSRDDLLRL